MLLEDDALEFLDVVQALRPDPGPDGDRGPDDLGYALQQEQAAGDRNQRLERIDRRSGWAERGMLIHHPAQFGEMVAGIDEGEDAGQEEDEIKNEVESGL